MNKQCVVAIIPARGGSKGVPKKNIKMLLGKPLIAYSIDHAINSIEVDKVIVSTDCAEIANISEEYGAEVIYRPSEISGDFSSSEDALIHCVNSLKKSGVNVTHIAFLQCTSPIRNPSDIDKTIKLVLSDNFDSALSAVENHSFIWRTNNQGLANPLNYEPQNRKMRQEITEYRENGSIYVVKSEDLLTTKCRLNGRIGIHIMEEETGYEIDTPVDFKIVEELMRNK